MVNEKSHLLTYGGFHEENTDSVRSNAHDSIPG